MGFTMRTIIFILIALLSLLSPIHAYAEEHSIDRIVAIVNDGIITERQVLNEEKKARAQLREAHVPMPPEKTLYNKALDHLIDKELQLQLAKNGGIEVDDATVDQSINDIAKRNHIPLEVLKQKLAAEGISFPTYRQDLREQIILSQIQQRQLMGNLTVSDDEVKDIQTKIKSMPQGAVRYHVIDLFIPVPENAPASAWSTADAKARDLLARIQKGSDFSHLAILEAAQSHVPNGGDFGWQDIHQLPDLFSEKVQHMSKGQVAGPLRAGNGLHIIKLEDVQGTQASSHYTKQTHVRHILIKTDKTTNDEMAKMRLLQLKEKMTKNPTLDFGEMAKANSQDTQSNSKGGDLDWVPQGILDPNFEQTMDHLAMNQIGGPVKTRFGWHLIQVLGRRQVEDSKTLISNEARGLAYQKKMQQALPGWLQQLRSSAYVKKY